MRKFYLSLITILFLAFNTSSIVGQEQKFILDDWLKSLTSIERFNSLADYHTENLVFKLLQFTAPYGGGYRETFLSSDGTSYFKQVTPRAIRGNRRATLNKSQVEEIKRKLSEFSSKGYNKDLQPQEGQLYSAFVFSDGINYLRFNFVGEIPNEPQEVIDIINVEYEKSEKLEEEAFLSETKLLKEKYGDWLEKPGIIHPSSVGSGSNNKRTASLFLNGVRQPIKDMHPVEIPLYYALVFHPEARVVGGVSSKENRSDNPISTNGIGWALNEGYKVEKELVITYDSINGTIATGNKTYKLTEGNVLIVRMNNDWKPKITQLKVHLEKATDIQNILDRFKKELGDETPELP